MPRRRLLQHLGQTSAGGRVHTLYMPYDTRLTAQRRPNKGIAFVALDGPVHASWLKHWLRDKRMPGRETVRRGPRVPGGSCRRRVRVCYGCRMTKGCELLRLPGVPAVSCPLIAETSSLHMAPSTIPLTTLPHPATSRPPAHRC
jgi:hypothetical protein